MILFQDFSGLLEIQAFLVLDAPGQLGHPFQVGARDRCFAAVRVHSLQLFQLPLDLRHHFFGDSEFGQFFPESLDLLGQFRTFSKLLLDGLQLLAEVILPLTLVNLALGIQGDFLLHLQQLDFPRQQLIHALEAGEGLGDLQDFLKLLGFQFQVGGHEIRKTAGAFQIGGDDEHILGHGLAQGHGLFQGLLHGAHEGIRLQCWGHAFGLGDRLHPSFEQLFGLREILHPHALDALHQGADAAVRQLEHAHDECSGPDLIKVIRTRVIRLHLLLAEQQDHPALHQGRVHRADGFLAADAQGLDDERIDHHIP